MRVSYAASRDCAQADFAIVARCCQTRDTIKLLKDNNDTKLSSATGWRMRSEHLHSRRITRFGVRIGFTHGLRTCSLGTAFSALKCTQHKSKCRSSAVEFARGSCYSECTHLASDSVNKVVRRGRSVTAPQNERALRGK